MEYMENNPVFLQIKRDLVHTTEGKPCLLKQDIKKEGKFPKEIYSMNKKINGGDCGICLDAITTFRGILNTRIKWKDHGDMKRGPCDHLFCFECIEKWSKKHNTCPTCRQTFTRVEKFNIQTQTSDEMLKVKKIQNDERQSQVRLEFNLSLIHI